MSQLLVEREEEEGGQADLRLLLLRPCLGSTFECPMRMSLSEGEVCGGEDHGGDYCDGEGGHHRQAEAKEEGEGGRKRGMGEEVKEGRGEGGMGEERRSVRRKIGGKVDGEECEGGKEGERGRRKDRGKGGRVNTGKCD